MSGPPPFLLKIMSKYENGSQKEYQEIGSFTDFRDEKRVLRWTGGCVNFGIGCSRSTSTEDSPRNRLSLSARTADNTPKRDSKGVRTPKTIAVDQYTFKVQRRFNTSKSIKVSP
ncbi:hypothetical protein AVEN_53300-1 [Araneus ventricosus]|uniref:Uncharacterized protein n=1 Tax=Araneus ventricosus TaxID=182803 RepID=A0A4Y2A9V5_ARAVE|nr:hypothetical protein AVEN_53300-1 [Araneus ventricosus]